MPETNLLQEQGGLDAPAGEYYEEPGTAPQRPTPEKNTADSEKQPVRRVGWVTLGVGLIGAGILALIGLLCPSFDLSSIFRFAPVLLILLGIEVFASHLLYRHRELKFSFLSALFCIVLIVMSMGVSIAAPLYERYGPHIEVLSRDAAIRAEKVCMDALSGRDEVLALQTNAYLHGILEHEKTNADQPRFSDTIGVDMLLGGEYADKEAFALTCRELLDRLKSTRLTFEHVTFHAKNEQTSYSMVLSGALALENNAEELAQIVRVV